MEMDFIVQLIYGYARAACRNTPLDYRDVAHTVVVNHITRYRLGKIRHVRTYLYIATNCTVARMMKSSALVLTSVPIEVPVCYDMDAGVELDLICGRMTRRECALLDMTMRGYTRAEMARDMGLSVSGVNVAWHRMVARLKEAA